jgi:hypothetical protein
MNLKYKANDGQFVSVEGRLTKSCAFTVKGPLAFFKRAQALAGTAAVGNRGDILVVEDKRRKAIPPKSFACLYAPVDGPVLEPANIPPAVAEAGDERIGQLPVPEIVAAVPEPKPEYASVAKPEILEDVRSIPAFTPPAEDPKPKPARRRSR